MMCDSETLNSTSELFLMEEFDTRFQDKKNIISFKLSSSPFSNGINEAPEHLQMKYVDFQLWLI